MNLYKKQNFADFTTYLSGPMEYQRDDCMVWRNEITEKLIVLGIPARQIIDPVKRTKESDWRSLEDHRVNGRWDEVVRMGKKVYQKDLRFVDKSDFIIVHLFDGIKTCGTWDEVFMGRGQRKPVFVINPGGLKRASLWLVARVGYEQIFNNIDEVIERLRQIRDGETPLPKGWRNVYEDE